MSIIILPRRIRLKDAPAYLGISKNIFNQKVRPCLQETHIGKGDVGFDRLDLDAWYEDHKRRSDRPLQTGGKKLWGENVRRASICVKAPGMSIKKYKAGDFVKALEQVRSKKLKST